MRAAGAGGRGEGRRPSVDARPPGGLALYFRRRAAAAQAHVDEAPDWAREAVEALGD